MQIKKKFFPKVMKHNDEVYFAHLEGIIDSVDELCSMEVIKHPRAYSFRIAPSLPKYTNLLIEELFKFHNMFQIKLNMSKSIKTNATIAFEITLD
jgi:hypothetical protein